MEIGQKWELLRKLIGISQIYDSTYDHHETWYYKKIYTERVEYIYFQ